ncbi:MAG: phage portal protein [Clostridia bacterium]|nr:phage portal protein [Clostridia bacterium]
MFSETARLNNIITEGAKTRLTDKQFLEYEIAKWKRSPRRKDMIEGAKYYQGEHKILKRKRTAIGRDGKLQEIENLPNNKIIDNQYSKIVDQKVNYLLGKPLTLNSENKQYEDILGQIFSRRFQRLLKNICEDSLNGGIGWLYVYYDETGALSFKKFEPYEILPFWKDAEHTVLDCAVRLYEVDAYEGNVEKIIEKVEVYDMEGVRRFELQNNTLVPDMDAPLSPHLVVIDEDGKETGYNWGKIPLIPFKYNTNELPLIKRVKSLQDGINEILSDFQNNMQEDSRNTILVIKNYDGTDLGDFRRNLTTYGAVKVKTVDGADGAVDTLTIDVNADNYKAILELMKKALIENARGYDVAELRSAGSPNEMNIKSIFNDIDLDANGMETEYQAAFEDLLWFINQHLANNGKGDFENEKVNIIFNRDTVVNESQVIADCKSSIGILSNETIISQHPWVTDVKEELKKVKQEKEEAQAEADLYSNAFNQNNSTEGGAVNET